MVVEGTLALYTPVVHEWRRIRELMNQYADMPLDIADATLISAAEQLGERRLFTIDNQLRAVCIFGRDVFDVFP
jgi:hypothetical protein